jgi:hypothetical protein
MGATNLDATIGKTLDRKLGLEGSQTLSDRFDAQDRLISDRFDAQDRLISDRFDAQDRLISDRFDALSDRFDALSDRFDAQVLTFKKILATQLAAAVQIGEAFHAKGLCESGGVSRRPLGQEFDVT